MILSTFRPEYLPALEYFWYLAQCDHAVLTDHFQYVKRSPLNISAPLSNQQDQLRIPVRHDHAPKPIFKKNAAPASNWRKKNFNTICNTFNSYPYSYYYLPAIEDIYNTTSNKLSDVLFALIQKLSDLLHLQTQIHRASKLKYDSENETSILQWCRHTLSNTYLSSQNVFQKGWVDKNKLLNENITCKQYYPFPESHIFISHKSFSILNFLFTFGPEAGYLIKQYMPKEKS